MSYWTSMDSDPPESMAPEWYAPGVLFWMCVCLAGASLGAWLAWG